MKALAYYNEINLYAAQRLRDLINIEAAAAFIKSYMAAVDHV